MRPAVTMPRGARWVAAAIILVAGAVLVNAGLGAATLRTYALRAPNLYFVAALGPGGKVCEGPVTSPLPFRTVGLYGVATTSSATLRVSAQAASGGRVLASGLTAARPVPEELTAQLNTAVAGGAPVRVCVAGEHGRFAIGGAQTGNGDHALVMTGAKPGQEFSLLLLGRPRSLFSDLPAIFSRAARFRPSWVGAWTFWGLGAGLLGAFALAVVAVMRALEADSDNDSEMARER